MKFVIFHGAFSNPEANWFPELKEKLEALGQEVIVPKFPVEDWIYIKKQNKTYKTNIQTLNNWIKVFDDVYKTFKKNEKLCFIGHSLGPLFILHIIEKYNIQLDSAIFVSPFLDQLPDWHFNIVNNSFYKTNFDFEKLKHLIPVSYVLFSDNDPYVPLEKSKTFAEKLASSSIMVRHAGHLNAEVNLNEFPLIFEICKTRLDLTLYQKYLAHRKELYAIDYIKGKNEEVVYLSPDEIFHEGVFKFRNLKKRGFCTFYTALDFWDENSPYYEEARKAAKRIKNFTRVFIIDRLSDLNKVSLQKQISLDIESGINVCLCNAKDVIDKFYEEPDFGVWDDEYLCVVEFNDKKEVVRVRMSSRKEDIKKAKIWEKKILQKATQIFSLTEIPMFKKNMV